MKLEVNTCGIKIIPETAQDEIYIESCLGLKAIDDLRTEIMKRKEALEIIKVEFAEHGKATPISTRTYIENRISHGAYLKAANAGLDIYMANAPRVKQFDGVVDRAPKAV